MLLVGGADAAADGTALAQRVTYAEAYHRIDILRAFGQIGQELAHYLEGVATVEVVAVDDGKRFLDGILAHHDGVVCSPGFRTAFGAGEAFGQGVERLEYKFAGDVSFILGEDFLAEVLFEVFADNEDEFAESGLDGVVDGVIHDGFTVGTQSVQLFQASVAAAHAGCQ